MDADVTTQRPHAGEELRLALSLRGGVSLAVWIGGALAELDHLAHAKDAVPQRVVAPTSIIYDQLLDLTGFDRVLIDVITGASAGGLNGVIYAASQIYGFAFDTMLDVWIELGDIEKLTRPPVGRYVDPNHPNGPKIGRPPSLLRGDEYFQRQLEAQLMKSIAGSEAETRADPLELILTATLARPAEVERDDDPFTNIVESRNSALFRFQYLGRPDDDGDFQTRQTAVVSDATGRALPVSTAARLALAGRATSSFPFAFEPARIGPAMATVFSDAPPTGAVWVIDGGVLDNIPVGKAIDAIAASPAASKTERWLLYLHPSPPGVGTLPAVVETVVQGPAPRGVHTALGALGTAFGQENLLQDLEQLRLFNEEAERQRLRRAGLFIRFDGVDGSALADAVIAAGTNEASSAGRLRIDLDTQRLHDVLTGQIDTSSLGDELPRNPTARWLRPDRDALESLIAVAVRQTEADGAVHRDGISMLSLIDELIRWVRDLESRCVLDVSSEKQALYSLRLVADRLRLASDRVWVVRAALDRRDQAWATTSARIARSLAVASVAQADEVLAALDRHTALFVVDQALDGWDKEVDSAALANTAPATGVLFADELWKRLVSVAAGVGARASSGSLIPTPTPTTSKTLAVEFLGRSRSFDVLDSAGLRMDEVLAALAVLTTALQARTTQMETQLRFLEVSGNNTTPLEKYFGRKLDAKSKLCGNDLSNFAAFFSAQWRGNDWMWGRLDASKSIVDLLLRPERLNSTGLAASEVSDRLVRIATAAQVPMTADVVQQIHDEVGAAMQDRTLPGQGALLQTKSVIVEAVQRQIIDELLDRVLALGESATNERADVQPDGDPIARLATYRVGEQTIASLNPRRRTQIGMRLAMVGFKAVQPDGNRLRTRAARGAMRLTKPVYLYAAFAALSLPRALFLVCFALAGLLIGPWRYRTWRGFSWWKPFELPRHTPFAWNALHLLAIAVLIGLSASAFTRFMHWRKLAGRAGNQRWRLLAALCAPVGIALDAFDVRTTPVMVIVGAAVITALATSWMVPAQRAVSTTITVIAYASTALAAYALAHYRHGGLPLGSYSGWWSIVSGAVAGSVLAVQCSYADVTPSVDQIRHR